MLNMASIGVTVMTGSTQSRSDRNSNGSFPALFVLSEVSPAEAWQGFEQETVATL
jgi:hypothetical protein